MTASPAAVTGAPAALHRGMDELPFIYVAEGVQLQVLQIDIEAGLWVIRNRFDPNTTIDRHKHTGEVYAFTTSGSWKYLEYPEVNTAGSYLYEPAGSIHTLHVPETNEGPTEVQFAIRGANLNLDDDGNIISVLDAGVVLGVYWIMCENMGFGEPNVIGTTREEAETCIPAAMEMLEQLNAG